jgi:integrase
MAKNLLNDSVVKNSKPAKKVRYLNDGDRLKLRIQPSGTKSWIFRYTRPHVGKANEIGLGPYPSISLSDARRKADEYRQQVGQGIDPASQKKAHAASEQQRLGQTFKSVAASWLEIHKPSVTSDYADDIWRSLELHIIPYCGNTPISNINAPEMIRILQPLKYAGKFEAIRRLCQRLNKIMIYAVNTGSIHANPLQGIGDAFQKPSKNHQPTIDAHELPEFLNTLTYASINISTRIAIELQLITLTRPSEIACATWDEIDFESATWTIPSERMKMKRPHIIPLTNEALMLLSRMNEINGRHQFIFASHRNPKDHMSAQSANMAIKRMGYAKRLTAHGLRALGSTILNDHGFDAELIEHALSHVSKNEVRNAYNRGTQLARRRHLMEWWSGYIEDAKRGVLRQYDFAYAKSI